MSDFTTDAKEIIARKDHRCCCYEIYVDSGYGLDDIPEVYREAVKRMQDKKGIIQKGEKCLYWSGRFDGEFFRAYADADMLNLINDMEWTDQ